MAKGKEGSKFGMYIAYLSFMIVITIMGMALMAFFDISQLNLMWVVTLSIDVFSIFTCIILVISCVLENSTEELMLRFVQLMAFLATNIFLDMCCWLFDGRAAFRNLVIFSNTIYYMFNSFIPVLFMEYIFAELNLTGKKLKRVQVVYVLTLVSAIELIVNLFVPYLFTVNENGVYARTDWFMVNLIPSYVCMILILITGIQFSKTVINKLVIFTYLLFPLLGMILQMHFYGLSISMPCVLLSMLLIYTQIHLNRKKKLAEQDVIMTQQSVALMVSQMQPHFLYNVLTTISNLCRTNPEEAEIVTVNFSRYLRANLDAMRKTDLIPFDAEMRHIKIYLELEKKRFGDRLNYEFDIQDSGFLLPALSIQPIVENSVKHGICDKGEPGTLKISTYADNGNSVIVIEDDGVGFDTTAPAKEDGRSHVGMMNTKNRLEKMCNATVEIVSSIGNGCKTTITIPKKG